MALSIVPYDRRAAVMYAHQWAFGRNPRYYDYEEIGGDCTNFASQCLYAGSKVMNFTPTYGWYYINANNKSPAWTGVPYFFDFLTRQEQSVGPMGVESTMELMLPGDFVQLRFKDKEIFSHTPVIVSVSNPPSLQNILVAAHSIDADWRPIDTYPFQEIRFLHIIGVSKP